MGATFQNTITPESYRSLSNYFKSVLNIYLNGPHKRYYFSLLIFYYYRLGELNRSLLGEVL